MPSTCVCTAETVIDEFDVHGLGVVYLQSDDVNNMTVKNGTWTHTEPAVSALLQVNPVPPPFPSQHSSARSRTTLDKCAEPRQQEAPRQLLPLLPCSIDPTGGRQAASSSDAFLLHLRRVRLQCQALRRELRVYPRGRIRAVAGSWRALRVGRCGRLPPRPVARLRGGRVSAPYRQS